MSTLLLSLLLVFLILAGMLMAKPIREHFENPVETVKVSPTLLNLIATPNMPDKLPQIDTLARDKETLDYSNKAVEPKQCPEPKCPKPSCPVCPDMSQYIRLDEIPCWNCSLP